MLPSWWRGGAGIRGKGDGTQLISPYTVNDTTEQLKKLFTRAKTGASRFDHEPKWREALAHGAAGARARVGRRRRRAARSGDARRLSAVFPFAQATGLRLRECLLRWSEVDWDGGRSASPARAASWSRVPITPTIRAILWPLRGHHPELVFTYVAQRPRRPVQGRALSLTYNGVQEHWRRLRKRAGVTGFRFHDFRHDFGTKLLRETGNLKLVQRALNHAISRPRRAMRTCSTTRSPTPWSASQSLASDRRDQGGVKPMTNSDEYGPEVVRYLRSMRRQARPLK